MVEPCPHGNTDSYCGLMCYCGHPCDEHNTSCTRCNCREFVENKTHNYGDDHAEEAIQS